MFTNGGKSSSVLVRFVGNRHVARNAKRDGRDPNEDGPKIEVFFKFLFTFQLANIQCNVRFRCRIE